MRAAPPRHSRLLSVGSYRPSRVVTNEEVCTWIDSSDEWIRQRTGIESRRWSGPGEDVVMMAVAAAQDALARAGVAPEDVDAVVLATISHPYATPSAAALVAGRLGTRAAAFDLGAACSGFCHALAVGSSLVSAGSARHVLVIGSERLSEFVDRSDRSSSFLFADGAGAVLLGPSDEVGIGPVVWGSDGTQADAVRSKASWLEVRDGVPPVRFDGRADDATAVSWPDLTQAGQQVFRWAVWSMAPVARAALDAAGVTADDITLFVPHQANGRIIDAMVKQLALPEHVHVARDVVTAGNTSGASVPLALARAVDEGHAPSGSLALLVGFGAGLSWAAQVVRVP